MDYFTSDQHFGHANILRYEPENRVGAWGNPFKSIAQMDEYLIDQWNLKVMPHDRVYCLGDFSFKQYLVREYLPYLNGEKILIVGNHDPYYKNIMFRADESKEATIAKAIEAGFSAVHTSLNLSINDLGIAKLSHYPYRPTAQQEAELPEHATKYAQLYPPRDGAEDVLIHGHVHGKWRVCRDDNLTMVNVGVDVWKLAPVSATEIIGLCNAQENPK